MLTTNTLFNLSATSSKIIYGINWATDASDYVFISPSKILNNLLFYPILSLSFDAPYVVTVINLFIQK